ncbi:MAG: alpha/beta hydrolase [Bacteroidia bacterium]|nr:alpha/beta hydrolase [Bacteroidia bacterium]
MRNLIFFLLFLQCTLQVFSQTEELPTYQRNLYYHRSNRYNFAVSVLKTVMKKRAKEEFPPQNGRQWFPKGKHYKGCLITVEKMGQAEVYCLSPKNVSSDEVLLYFHGGSYITGPYSPQWTLMAHLAKDLGRKVYLVDYRLAPENPFPAGLDDSYSVFRELCARHGHDKISLIGDSAGGGMCLSVAQKARDEGPGNPRSLVLISPWLYVGNPDPRKYEIAPNDPLLVPDSLHKSGYMYNPEGDFQNPLVSPYFASLKGLPPMLLLAGSWDILYPECQDFAARAKQEGHDFHGIFAREMFHVWPIGVGFFPEAKIALQQIESYLLDH